MSAQLSTHERKTFLHNPLAWAALFALVKLALHFSLNSYYGYFRDELYYIACGEHLAFGYPDHAPLIAFVTKLSRTVFGDSLFALRLFPAFAGATKIFLTGLFVREFGGKRFAVILACTCALVAPAPLALDNLLSMNAFESVFWMLCAYLVVLFIKRRDGRLWLWFGIVAGIGLMNKHSMLFFGFALIVGLLLTSERKVFLNKWIWIGGVAALLVFTPNIIWQIQNDWATLELLANVKATNKNVVLSPLEFVWQQIFILSPPTALVWLAGIWFFLFDKCGKRFRALGIAYLVLLVLMIALKAKNYYLLPVYPYLFAGGAVWLESLTTKHLFTRTLKLAFPVLLLIAGLVTMPLALPVLSIENFLRYQNALGIAPPKTEVAHEGVLPQVFGDQFGWQEMTAQVASIYHNLPPAEQSRTRILAFNYGEAGAIDFFGRAYDLPPAISPHQSYYLWGKQNLSGETFILLGLSQQTTAEKLCRKVERAGETNHPLSMTEEKYPIWICRDLREPLPDLWHKLKNWN
ncbi:MAG: glycosyltransferase family 39 protein [Pyrinomonadaceae bacterium MAG19_C2-C3]|nr:glycosyltransferase family 39 protein [Pyrinomonadaceae bacterium MAG19_C2-C3]